MYPSLWYHTECFHCPKNPLCSDYSSFPSPLPLESTDVFIDSMPFLECHIVEIIQYVAFSYWLLSLSHMHLSFLHVFSWLDSSFLL